MVKKESQPKDNLLPRPPIAAVLGHIDHGKTTLLDYIRKTHLAEKEFGGITQHIGAYQVEVKTPEGSQKITFIDTPGHEVFAKMRSRGAKVADIAVLVVAVNEGVKPQTKESIKFINEAKIPLIVALNKIDLSGQPLEKIKRELLEAGVKVEGYGGEVVAIPVSAKTGKGVKELLEMIVLLSQMEDIRADPKGNFAGVVVESKMNRQRGPSSTILVKNGTLKIGQEVVSYETLGRIRAMFDENGGRVLAAPPGKPVEVLGFKEVLAVGSEVQGISLLKETAKKEVVLRQNLPSPKSLIKIILKADTKGSLEAISENLSGEAGIIFGQTGDVNESDILLAKTTGAAVIGFNVRIPAAILKLAAEEKVKIKIYEIIYKLLEEIEEAALCLKEKPKEEVLGRGEIIAKFRVDKQEVAGTKILKGKINRGDKLKILRGEKEIGLTRVKSIHHLKEDVSTATQGKDYGILFSPQLDFEEKDAIISYILQH